MDLNPPESASPSAPLPIAIELVWSLAKLVLWLLALSYIEPLSPAMSITLTVFWIGAFIWWNALRNPGRKVVDRLVIGLDLPKAGKLSILWLTLIVVLGTPWTWAFLTASCTYNDLRATAIPITNSFAPQSFAPLAGLGYLVLRTIPYPLAEEFCFRRWMLSAILRKLPTHAAVIGTAAAFALLHLQPDLIVSHFAFGLIVGYVTVATRSIWPAVFIHFSANLALAVLSSGPAAVLFKRHFGGQAFQCSSSGLISVMSYAGVAAILVCLFREKSAVPLIQPAVPPA